MASSTQRRNQTMKLRNAVLLICALFLATPVFADKLPAPRIFGIKLSEMQMGGEDETSWCVGIAWKRVAGARFDSKPNRRLDGYAIRLWTEGNRVPDFVDFTYPDGQKMYGLFAPTTSEWSKLRDTGWAEAKVGRRKNLSVTTCGYAEHQQVHLKVRAIDQNRKYGKVSKKFTVYLPEYGAYGEPQYLPNTDYFDRGHVVFGKWLKW
ncbi:MAG: hypothetical protein OXI77_14195 [Chloroflexota bacterium]|nr:hypothetical protein [Chloroflexota bacterium]MDE2909969.1 hypothetical protein [Chloroflexota bacterium]